MQFPIVIHKDQDSDYGVTVPDLAGCFSGGETLVEAIQAAEEAALCHIEGLLTAGEPIPEAKPLEEHQAAPEFQDGIWALVTVDLSRLSSKARRVNITVPARVLAIVDEAAARHGETRSGFLARAALQFIEHEASA